MEGRDHWDVLQRLFKCALSCGANGPVHAAEFAPPSGLTAEEAERAADQLLAMGLLRRAPDGRLAAVAPDEAVATTVGPLERELRAERSRIEQMRRQLMSFMPAFEASLTHQRQPSQFEVIPHLGDVLVLINELTAASQEEILAAQPGGPRAESVTHEAISRDEDALARGVHMRVLYQHTARFSDSINACVGRLSRLGAQVRTLNDHFTRLLVFDNRTAVIEVPGDPHAAAVVREPNVVAFITATYERLWLAAKPFTVDLGVSKEIEDDLRQAIIRLLIEGMTDNSIAARLGMSVRTCRRHIASLMAELNAQSRFQAGYALMSRKGVRSSRERNGCGA